MTPDFLVTHSGGFHADELLSSVILTRLFPQARIIRSRAPEWITPGADRIIYDVGGKYDAAERIYDHHQRGAPLRDDGQPYSSFGLIWKHYGRDYLSASGLPEAHIEALHTSFDNGFVLPVDLVDNGALSPSVAGQLAGLTLPALLETLKPVFDETDPEAEDRGFQNALGIARSFVEARIGQSAAKLRAEALVHQAIVETGEGRILELPMGMPFRPAIVKAGADHLLFVVHPRDKDWCLTGIRRADQGFELRADLPAAWAGLTNGDLEAASGVEGASFCHNGRFIAAAKTREAALAMAELAVTEAVAIEQTLAADAALV
ncbi:MYG1 family protein [Agrobacterium rhizogenes]|uniref:Metal-dependent hydrolase protein n=1 Tax=Rhizobium rhizogenes (strain K84 / ATCC BAA-868) TaxID=311403 RepID=B9J7D7_RHIR8|nr:MYG1 family protein [Rhizobium rhizogenes]ACM27244.1 metal-dependent hydrolase protein [Rhizobium rhizogenes K84]OCJ26282.1 metal-dependent hydrolase [Agrobacterium sp. B131/95]KEA06161.1 metal-dependent hydrolase [Rhizobium rhizogenes]MDJ1635846.1 MYG1 family protein [Rhizobium rhizogenes]MQB30285.1 MYG1 family protein [Rhizobium rhizogenes]